MEQDRIFDLARSGRSVKMVCNGPYACKVGEDCERIDIIQESGQCGCVPAAKIQFHDGSTSVLILGPGFLVEFGP